MKFNWNEYTRQYVQAVDMCAACIFSHRQRMIPIRAIHLLPNMYGQFKLWTEKNLGRELLPEEELQFDDVKIALGDSKQKTPLLVELWADYQKPFAIA